MNAGDHPDAKAVLDVLLIEDNDGDARLVARYLERGANPVAVTLTRCACLTDGLTLLTGRPWDLVLLDLGLPEERGLAVLEIVLSRRRDVPVLVLTGLDDESTAMAALREGAQDYLTKDVLTPQTLERAIRYALERHRLQGESARLMRRLAQSEKIDALGRLAGGLAHEINNRLQPVVALAEVLRDSAGADDPRRRMLDVILRSADEASGLIRDVLTFARGQSDETRQPLDLTQVFGDALRMMEAILPSGTRLQPVLPAGLPTVLGHRGRLSGILMNLVSNAADSLTSRQGCIDVVVDTVPPDGAPGEARQAATTQFVRLTVADDGSGMDEATLARVFEPFFTTKAVDQGTGLGLSIVHGTVRDHGGAIVIDSAPGSGTRVEVFLPALAESP